MFSESSPGRQVEQYFNSTSGDIRYVISPFIQKATIERILPDDGADTVVITRWRRDDLMSGVSDPEVFEFCRERGYTLKCNPRLHAKVYSWDLDDALVGSANLTDSGMGEGESTNIEVLAGPFDLTTETKLKLRRAEKQSSLVTESGYERALEISKQVGPQPEPNQEGIDFGNCSELLISNLPTTETPEIIVSVLQKDDRTLDDLPEALQRCVLHDICTFSLEELEGCSEDTVRDGMQQRFEEHPFIRRIIDQMKPEIYFGETKEFIQKECTDVPTPSRRELTEDVQILYTWFREISSERFKYDIPGARSERLIDTHSSLFEG